jgi:hypothetical protein
MGRQREHCSVRTQGTPLKTDIDLQKGACASLNYDYASNASGGGTARKR